MATTFKTLSDLADFAATGPTPPVEVSMPPVEVSTPSAEQARKEEPSDRGGALVVHHDVHVHLPLSTDIAVYDAIFRSLRENLM